MTANEQELYELVISLQAEISALKEMMLRANHDLAAEHQRKTDELREILLRHFRRNHSLAEEP
jgi:hypothetical protein